MLTTVLSWKKFPKWEKALPYLFVIGGFLGLLASFTLTYDKIQLLQDPSYKPACSLNPVISCGSVMKTAQASIFGVPNSVFGLIGFSMLAMLGVVLLAGATLKRWLWLAAEGMAILGVLFVHYLFYQSLFQIGSVCPWCFLVWLITIAVFWGLTTYNMRVGNIKTPSAIKEFFNKYSADVLILWYVALFAAVIIRFWDYWKTLLP